MLLRGCISPTPRISFEIAEDFSLQMCFYLYLVAFDSKLLKKNEFIISIFRLISICSTSMLMLLVMGICQFEIIQLWLTVLFASSIETGNNRQIRLLIS